MLKAPDSEKPFKLQVDASDIGFCYKKGIVAVITLYVTSLINLTNYSTMEKEALALLLSQQHFDVDLGTTIAPVEVYADHNLLVLIEKMKNKNQRLLLWSLAFQEYNLRIRLIRGRDNVIANASTGAIVWTLCIHSSIIFSRCFCITSLLFQASFFL